MRWNPPSLFRVVPLSLFLHCFWFVFLALSSSRTASRRGSGVKFILQIYSFIYCERLFTPVPTGRITAVEWEMRHPPPTGSYDDARYDWPLYRRFLIAAEDITIFLSFTYDNIPILNNWIIESTIACIPISYSNKRQWSFYSAFNTFEFFSVNLFPWNYYVREIGSKEDRRDWLIRNSFCIEQCLYPRVVCPAVLLFPDYNALSLF